MSITTSEDIKKVADEVVALLEKTPVQEGPVGPALVAAHIRIVSATSLTDLERLAIATAAELIASVAYARKLRS